MKQIGTPFTSLPQALAITGLSAIMTAAAIYSAVSEEDYTSALASIGGAMFTCALINNTIAIAYPNEEPLNVNGDTGPLTDIQDY